jgi:hypothetical protein
VTNYTSERGSVAIEAIASTGFAALVLSGALALCFFLFARSWLKRAAYEAAVCMASGVSVRQCEWDLNATVDAALPVGRLNVSRFTVTSASADVDMTWTASTFTLGVHESIALPLVKTARFL